MMEEEKMNKTAFVNCNLFVGVKDEVLENAWFVVDDETGKLVAQGIGTLAEKADKVVDLDNQYVMSGMLNSHTHLGLDLTNDHPVTETSTTYLVLQNLQEALKTGVTYVRSCGVDFDVDIKLKKLRPFLPFEGPGLMPAGMPISIPGGHGDSRVGENLEKIHLI